MSTLVIAREKTVAAAIAEVRCSSSGTEHFKTRTEAEAFQTALYDKYHPVGYGTSCDVRERYGVWVATWYVGSAD